MIYRADSVDRGIDGMGYKLMAGATIIIFAVRLIDCRVLDVCKEVSGVVVWHHVCDDATLYSSRQLLADFTSCFGLRKASFIEDSTHNVVDDVLARFKAVCPDKHTLCFM